MDSKEIIDRLKDLEAFVRIKDSNSSNTQYERENHIRIQSILRQISILREELEDIEKAKNEFAKNTLDDLYNYL